MSGVILLGSSHSFRLLGGCLGLLSQSVGSHQRCPRCCSVLSLLRCLGSVCSLSCYTLGSSELITFRQI